MLKMRLAVDQSASCIELGKYLEMKVTLALSIDIFVEGT